MFFFDAPMPPIQVIANLSAAHSTCAIVKRLSDDESGDLIEARCSSGRKSLGRALKGVITDRLSSCRVVVFVSAVHFPRALDVSNCRGALRVVDVGSHWTAALRKSIGLDINAVEFVSFGKVGGRVGCYDVAITYDVHPHARSSAYRRVRRRFCADGQS